jgi:hypothetical protein
MGNRLPMGWGVRSQSVAQERRFWVNRVGNAGIYQVPKNCTLTLGFAKC